jgi:septum formation protein
MAGKRTIFTAIRPLVLASASPRRKRLLASIGLEFEILPTSREPEPEAGEKPEEFCLRAATAKANEAAAQRPEAVVVAADTIVVLDDRIMGKPADESEAMLMLGSLAGCEHTVITGCSILAPDAASPSSFFVSTEVSMAPQALETLMAYASSGEPMDKAGAYAIQGAGAFLVNAIKGSYTNVVGLPLAEVLEALIDLRAVKPVQAAR